MAPGSSLAAARGIDAFVDRADAELAAHAIVDAAPDLVYEVARDLDLLQVRTPLLTASFFVRDLPARVTRQERPPPPARLSLTDGGLPGWVLLAEDAGREIVFGAVGVFWTPTIRWKEDVTAEGFAGFDEPGWGKIACNFATAPYGGHRTILTYDCRVETTDPASKRRFLRYWWLVRPFVGHVLRATVATIRTRAEAEAAAAAAAPPPARTGA